MRDAERDRPGRGIERRILLGHRPSGGGPVEPCAELRALGPIHRLFLVRPVQLSQSGHHGIEIQRPTLDQLIGDHGRLLGDGAVTQLPGPPAVSPAARPKHCPVTLA